MIMSDTEISMDLQEWQKWNYNNGTHSSKNDHIIYQNNKLLVYGSVNTVCPLPKNLIQPFRAEFLSDDFA